MACLRMALRTALQVGTVFGIVSDKEIARVDQAISCNSQEMNATRRCEYRLKPCTGRAVPLYSVFQTITGQGGIQNYNEQFYLIGTIL